MSRWWVRTAAAATALALLTRLPSFARAVWNPDEAFLAVQGRVLAGGGRLYVDVSDRKPPLLPVLYAVANRLAGDHAITCVRVLAVMANVGTALLLCALARRRWGSAAGLTAGTLFLVGSAGLAPEDAQAASFEVFMLPSLVASVVLADRRRWVAAGGCLAVAFLTKQVALATLLPVVALAWSASGRTVRGAVDACARTALGLAVPVVLAALVVGPSDFGFWVLRGGGAGYLDARGALVTALARGTGNLAILAATNLAAVVLAALAWRHRRADVELWLWLAGALLAVCTGLRFFGHYYLQLVPPLALIAAGQLHRSGVLHRPLAAAGMAVHTATVLLVVVVAGLLWPSGRLEHAHTVARAIEARTSPDDHVLVWGMDPSAQWLSGRAPASRFLTGGLVSGAGGGRAPVAGTSSAGPGGAWRELRTDLDAHPPALVVDDARARPGSPLAALPSTRLAGWLRTNYRRVGRIDGAVLWRRRATL